MDASNLIEVLRSAGDFEEDKLLMKLSLGCDSITTNLHATLEKYACADVNFFNRICLSIENSKKGLSLVMVRYSMAKYFAAVFLKFPQANYWGGFFNSDSATFIDFLMILLRQEKFKLNRNKEVDSFLNNFKLESIVVVLSKEKDDNLVCQAISVLELCFQVDLICSDKRFLEGFLKVWELFRDNFMLLVDIRHSPCIVTRRATSCLTILMSFCIQKRCRREAVCESQIFQKFSQKIADFYTQLVDIKFCHLFHWFGSGHSENTTGSFQGRLFVLFLLQTSTMRVLNPEITDKPATDLETLLKSILRVFTDCSMLTSSFLNNDEQLMELMICCTILWPNIEAVDGLGFLSPHEIWLNIMQAVGWDSSVVLDWLTSENSALLMLLLYLKLLKNRWNEFRITAAAFKPKAVGKSEQKFKFPACFATTNSGEAMQKVTVSENLGLGVFQTKEILLCALSRMGDGAQKSSSSKIPEAESQIEETDIDYLEMSLKFFNELNCKLGKLSLLPFNSKPLERLLIAIEEYARNVAM